jgi:hypothetical protein
MVNEKYSHMFPNNGVKPEWWVSEDIYENRLSICEYCPDLQKQSDLIKLCSNCGCEMNNKAWIDWFGCPKNKWKAEVELTNGN